MEKLGGEVSLDKFLLNFRCSQLMFVFSQKHAVSDFCALFSLTNGASGPPQRPTCSSRSEPLVFSGAARACFITILTAID